MKRIKRILAVVLSVALVCCMMNVMATAQEPAPAEGESLVQLNDYMLISENERLALYVNTATANIAVLDKNAEHVWKAYPEGDDFSASDSRTSMINVTYSSGNNISMQAGTHNSLVGFDVLKLESGLKEKFYFHTESFDFEIPIKVILQDDYIEITILYNEIKEEGSGKLCDIELLPNWGLGTSAEEGYVFIPDGSGAIIEYKDSVSRADTYSERVYGSDPSQDLIYTEISDSETVRLPVFGVKHKNSAILSVITSGDTYASVNASMSNGTVTAYGSFIYRESDLTGIQQSDGGTRTMNIVQTKPLDVSPCIRQYYLSDDDADYSGMANKYRSYLTENNMLGDKTEKATPAVAVEAFGSVSQEKTFLGIPYSIDLKVTTFDQLTDLSNRLKESGITDAPFYLYGFLKGGYESGVNSKPKYIGKLGGKKGYEKFTSVAGSENVYTVFNLSRSYGNFLDFFRSNEYTKSLNQTTVEQHYRMLSSGTWNTDFGSWKYYTVAKQKGFFTKLMKNLPENTNIVIEHSGEELISDFSNKATANRGEYLFFLKQMFQKCTESNIGIAFETGNAYSTAFAGEIYEAPLESSGYSIESYSIPFYSMVFHGYIPLSSTAANTEADKESFQLRAFEQGASVTWRVSGINSYQLKDTKLNFLYNSEINSLYDTAVSKAEDYNQIHSVLYDQCITDHRYEGALSITTYENGWQIVCNYGEKAVDYNGTQVVPTGYAVIR